MNYLRHPAWLWLEKHDKTKIPPIDSALQAMFDAGHEFEQYPERLFPDGVTISFDDYFSMSRRTTQAIERGVQTIFQPKFDKGVFTCISDIITFVDDKTIDLYEIKSSTSVHKDHLYDLAFQANIIESNQLKVRSIFVIYVNNRYIRHGAIDPQQMTITEDVTERVRELEKYTTEAMVAALQTAENKIMPDPGYGNLGVLGRKNKWKPIYENVFPLAGIESHSGVEVDATKIKLFLDTFEYPLYFLDYETMNSVVPYFDGHRPYQQVPTQYSLHVIREPGGTPEHYEYLHRERTEPSRPLAEQLIKDIGTHGSIIVWNQSFEKTRNSEIGAMYPELADAMMAINQRVVDLMIPFKNRWYADPEFGGSASIKNVLPVLCPELSYAALAINNGASAQIIWTDTVIRGKYPDQESQIFADLLRYCELDTWAMVAIWRVLDELAL